MRLSKLFAVLVLLLGSGLATAQQCWGTPSSGRSGRLVAFPQYSPQVQPAQYVQPAPAVTYEWRQAEADPAQHMLIRNGECVGGWCDNAQHFRGYSRGTWGPPVDRAPITPPKGYAASKRQSTAAEDPPQEMPPTGVDASKLSPKEKWTINGTEIDGPTAMRILSQSYEGAVPDDAAKRHLTLIARDSEGAKTARKALVDLGAEAVKDFRVQVYDLSRTVDKIMLEGFRLDADKRFQATGFVAIVQEPADASGSGKVLVGVYEPSKLAEAVRNPGPNWDPNKTPGPKTPTPPAPVPPSPTPTPTPSPSPAPGPDQMTHVHLGGLMMGLSALLVIFRFLLTKGV